MARLRRISDGEMEEGALSQAIAWNEDGTLKEIIGDYPVVGCSMKVGSLTAGTYSKRDWWLTTPITEILEEKIKDDILYVKFKTENSVYEFWGGNTSLWAETKRKSKDVKTKE